MITFTCVGPACSFDVRIGIDRRLAVFVIDYYSLFIIRHLSFVVITFRYPFMIVLEKGCFGPGQPSAPLRARHTPPKRIAQPEPTL